MMIFWIGNSAAKKDSLFKSVDRKTLVSSLLLILCWFVSCIIAPEALAQEGEASVFIKDFDFVLPNRPQETEAAKLLKQRRQQLQTIISSGCEYWEHQN